MSSVCPQQTLGELIATAHRYGYSGIEFRTEWQHRHGIELGATEQALASARRALADEGLAASCLATSVRFNSPNPDDHLPQRDTLRRYIALAAAVGAPCIRTFSDAVPEEDEAARNEVLRLAAESYHAVDDWANDHNVHVLVETHTNMRGHWAKQIVEEAGASNLGVLWHIGHHVSRGQSVDEAYEYVGPFVRHVHFAAQEGANVSDADNQRMFALLARDGYEGFISVEIINPPDPDEVLTLHKAKYDAFMQGPE